MRRVLPFPGLALALLLMWLLLMQSFSLGQILLGSVIAFGATHAMATLSPGSSKVRDWPALLKLSAIVAADVARSNIAVARIVLGLRANRKSSFIDIPLDLQNKHALAVLALILTATPGTAWVQFDRSTRQLLIHVFDLVDEEEWIDLIKKRYEPLLMAIFG
jgi:multicomponent K+:H+ antiporter subunit E